MQPVAPPSQPEPSGGYPQAEKVHLDRQAAVYLSTPEPSLAPASTASVQALYFNSSSRSSALRRWATIRSPWPTSMCGVISELGLPALLVRDLAQSPWRRRSTFRTLLLIQITMGFLTWGGLALLALLAPYGDTARITLLLVGASLPLFAVSSASRRCSNWRAHGTGHGGWCLSTR